MSEDQVIVIVQIHEGQTPNMARGATANGWPDRPNIFPDLMTPEEAAMFLRLDQTGHNPESARRTLNYWREQGELRATKFARRVWYLRQELEAFLRKKTEA
jgi:hypothetical protein